MAQADVVVGIIHYRDNNAVDLLLHQMDSWSLRPRHIYVADNSQDLSLSESARSIWQGQLTVLRMPSNVGYGPAANRILHEVGDLVESVLVATQDARLDADALSRMQNELEENPSVGVVVPLLVYASDPSRIFSSGGELRRNGRTLHPGQGRDAASYESVKPYDVDWGDGACTLLRKSVIDQIGGYDPNYFLYVEEVDLQLRVREAGYRITLVPEARGMQEPGSYSLYFKYRNLTYFTRKFKGRIRPWPWVVAYPKDSYRMLRTGRPVELIWAIRGLYDSIRGRMGPPPRGIFAK